MSFLVLAPELCVCLFLTFRIAKLLFFDTTLALALFTLETVALFFTYGIAPIIIVQAFSMLTTLTVVMYKSADTRLRACSVLTRICSLFVASTYFSPLEKHWFGPTVSFFTWFFFAFSTAYLSSAVLYQWYYDYRNDIAWDKNIVPTMKRLAQQGPFGRNGNMLFWSLFNSLCEESFSRLILYESLISVGVSPTIATTLQALDFGAMHFRYGFPFGLSGFFLSSMFGVSQGLLYVWTGGLFVPWMVHAAIDFYIFQSITPDAEPDAE